jgi:PAS domain S-box-containing protein
MMTNQEIVLPVGAHFALSSALDSGELHRAYTSARASSDVWDGHLKKIGHDPLASRCETSAAGIYAALGLDRPGPLLIQPLIADGARLGVILVGNPLSRRLWTKRDEQIVQRLGRTVASSLSVAYRRETGEATAELRRALGEAHHLAQRLAGLETQLEEEQRRSEELATRLRLREQERTALDQGAAEVSIWQDEVRDLVEVRTALETELTEWQETAKELERAKAELEVQLRDAQAELEGLRQAREFVGPAASSTTDALGGIMVGDLEGKIVLASQGAQKLLGQAQAELVGMPLQELFTEPFWGQTVRRLTGAEPGDQGHTAAAIVSLDGDMIQAEITRLPRTPHRLGGLAVMLYPEEKVGPQGQMALSLTEDLRTPLTSVSVYTDVLISEAVGILGEMQRQFLQRIKANVERMGKLLDDHLKATVIDSSQVLPWPKSVNLIEVIEGAVLSLSAEFQERDVSITLDVPSELAPVLADRDSLCQIVLNLLSNACHCSRPGSDVAVRAQLKPSEEDSQDDAGYILVSITDTGGGIAPEDRARVFQRLYRANNPLVAGLGDTGVGLSIAKTLVEAHGGRIWVESTESIGSTFSFVLPLSSDASSEEGCDAELVMEEEPLEPAGER